MRDLDDGTLEIAAGPSGRIFRTDVRAGRYSFGLLVLPAGPCKSRYLAPDGTPSGWQPLGDLDPGRHRLNMAF